MTRTLLLIAGAGFVLCVACLAGAMALGGPDVIRHHLHHRWSMDWDDGRNLGWVRDGQGGGALGKREIAWGGADGLDLDVPADVEFTQAPGPGKLVITGPQDALNRLELSGSRLQYNDDDVEDARLSIVMTAPDVRRFAIDGDGKITINGYDQDDLTVDVAGHGDVTAKGRARNEKVDISGDGDVNLAGLKADSADAEISGAGRASLAPASAADLHISGAGEIDMLTRPSKLTSDVSGAGRIVEGADATSQPG